MLYSQNQAHPAASSPRFEPIADPWTTPIAPPTPAAPAGPTWQFPLDPHHELGGQPTPAQLATGGPAGAAQLASAPGASPLEKTIAFLLEEELRLKPGSTYRLQDNIQAAISWLGLASTLAVQS